MMNQEQIIELMRIAYLQGHQDTVDGNVSWCNQGSREVAEEIYFTEKETEDEQLPIQKIPKHIVEDIHILCNLVLEKNNPVILNLTNAILNNLEKVNHG